MTRPAIPGRLDHRGGWLTIMWYKVKAKDNTIFLPDGKVLTFSIWAETDRQFWKLMKEKKCTEVKILSKTQEIILK